VVQTLVVIDYDIQHGHDPHSQLLVSNLGKEIAHCGWPIPFRTWSLQKHGPVTHDSLILAELLDALCGCWAIGETTGLRLPI
jgi:hypothetical protein